MRLGFVIVISVIPLTIVTSVNIMLNLAENISSYVIETRKLENLRSSTETSFYPDLKTLLSAVLKSERLPFDVITGTSERGDMGLDILAACCKAIRPDMGKNDTSEAGLTVEAILLRSA